MAVTYTSDSLLLLDLAEYSKVILKYNTDACGEPCTKLIPIYHRLSDDSRYKDIVFLYINADNNPVAKQFILNKLAPIVTIYYKGRLIESHSVTTEEEIINMLEMIPSEKE